MYAIRKEIPTDEKSEIEKTIQCYFHGTYEADAEKIRSAFHPKAVISGFFDGEYTEWDLEAFIQRVTSQPSQKSNHEVFKKEIVNIEVADRTAIVRAVAPAFGHVFTDFITLINTENGWKIRHKSFTNR